MHKNPWAQLHDDVCATGSGYFPGSALRSRFQELERSTTIYPPGWMVREGTYHALRELLSAPKEEFFRRRTLYVAAWGPKNSKLSVRVPEVAVMMLGSLMKPGDSQGDVVTRLIAEAWAKTLPKGGTEAA